MHHKTKEFEIAKSICLAIIERGYTAYFAGGCVRDMLLARIPKDYDIASDIPADELKDMYGSFDGGGDKYGVTHLYVEGYTFEVARFRSDGEYEDGRRPEDVTFTTPQQDALRRDFTINGMFYNPINEEIIDYVGGKEDIDAGLIRCIGSPELRFNEDKLRMMRLCRFYSQLPYGFKYDVESYQQIKVMNYQINQVSSDRIREELNKILTSELPCNGLYALRDTGLLQYVLPEVQAYCGCSQPPEHHPEGDVWEHTMRMLNWWRNNEGINGISKDTLLKVRLAILLHDVGKPLTRTEVDGKIQFLQHERVGEELAIQIMKRLKYSNDVIDVVAWLIKNHMRVQNIREMSKSKYKRLMMHPEFSKLIQLCLSDCISCGQIDEGFRIVSWCEDKKYRLNQEPQKNNIEPLLSGKDLIEYGLKPGPIFGKILLELVELQLEEEILNKEDAWEWLKNTYSKGDEK